VGNGSPYYVFIADVFQQRILCSNLASPSTLLRHESLSADLYQAYLHSPASSLLQFRSIKEDLLDVINKAEESCDRHLFRFRDENGYWRFGWLTSTTLHSGATADQQWLCGLITLAQNGSDGPDQPLGSQLVWMTDRTMRLTHVSGECRTLGFDPGTLLGSGETRFLPQETQEFFDTLAYCEFGLKDVDSLHCSLPDTRVVRQPICSVDGTPLSATIQFSLLFDENGAVLGALGIADFTPSRALLDSERQLFTAVFESISEGIFVTDRNGYILRANPAFYEVTGFTPQQILGLHCGHLWKHAYGPELFRKIRHTLTRDNAWREEITYCNAEGEHRPALMSFSLTHNQKNEVQHYVGVLMDIADKKQNERKIHRLAFYDALTEVGNRSLFHERLALAVEQAQGAGNMLAVLFLDMDRFKPVNDSLGHSAGDQLLKGVARRLLYCIGEGDTVARMGGDEFAIILRNLEPQTAEQTAIKTASRVLGQFYSPFMIANREVFTSCSIGIALFPHHGTSGELLLRSADTAMYAAKRAGKNNYQFFNDAMNKRAMDRLIMENAMRKALVNEDFELYFQPQYSVANGVMTGVEVLLRWDHPQFGNVKPLEFIHLAERTDLIIPLGEWVFQQTCEKMATWRGNGIEFGRVSINVSANQFKRKDFADWVLYQVKHYGIDPARLEIEITESALMEDVEHSLAVLQQLQAAKFRIAIDDFGTGYSSLSYLRRFPISTLKIDKAFIDDIELDKGTLELTQTVIAIAKSLKLGVIAEGVESWEQYRLLHEQGCDEVQGFYLSRALSETALLELVACEQG
jgi:diguanylate cyclase (GGDEF)-like protein/PAS domain S-box-containing protein